MDLTKAMEISASGMYAQGQRVRVIAENMANADFDRADRRRRAL